jgi:hypothetical protein
MSDQTGGCRSASGLLRRVQRTADRAFAALTGGASSDPPAGRANEGDPGGRDSARSAAPLSPVISDEERIHRYLRPHGGRMRQSELVECTEWSKAKVSRLLSELEDEGIIRKVRLGRENLVCLESRDPLGDDLR